MKSPQKTSSQYPESGGGAHTWEDTLLIAGESVWVSWRPTPTSPRAPSGTTALKWLWSAAASGMAHTVGRISSDSCTAEIVTTATSMRMT